MMLKTVIENMQKMAGFKLTFEFYKRLFIGIVLGFGADYFFNNAGEWRLRIFTFGVSIIAVFFCFKTIRRIKYNYYQKQAVNELNKEEREYVLRCSTCDEYFSFNDFSDYSNFETKWNYILSVPHGKMIEMYVPYRIHTDRRAVKLIKKKGEMMDDMFANIFNEDTLKDNLIFASIFIALYESFAESVTENPKTLLCDDCIEDSKYKQIETEQYKKLIKNRIVDDKGNKDITKASFLWFVDNQAFTSDEYNDFLDIKKKRNDIAHELLSLISKGFCEDDHKLFIKLIELYRKLDNWWINNFEIPIAGDDIPEDYDPEGVVGGQAIVYNIILDVIYGNKSDEYMKMYKDLKKNYDD